MSKGFTIELIQGVEGLCLSLNDYRIAGPKPWGGGKVIHKWHVTESTLQRALLDEVQIIHLNPPQKNCVDK